MNDPNGPGLVGAGEAAAREPLADAGAFYKALRAPGGLFAGGLSQPQVDGLTGLLAAMAAAHWPLAFAAYGLATPYLETAHTMQPIKEIGGAGYFTRMYDIAGARPAKARELGNLAPGDGARYAGRGYVQLTGKTNYARAGAHVGADLVGNPDLAMDHAIAAKVLVWGMETGAFTGKKLADYLPLSGPGHAGLFTAARRIINGQDRAVLIADEAMHFQAALQAGGWR